MSDKPKLVEFILGTGRTIGEVIKVNDCTVIVRCNRAGKSIKVKRHIEKHQVKFLEEENA